MAEKERRYIDFSEVRVKRDKKSGLPTIEGYAAVFNKLSENLGGFREKIAPGAFKSAIKKSNIRALFNHDPNIIIGRTGVNLTVKEDGTGLHMRIDPLDTPNYRAVAADIEAGLVTQQSFGFTVGKDSWEENKKSGEVTRTLHEIDELFDVSPVTYPAYPDTTVALRSYAEWKPSEEQREEHAEPSIGDRLSEISGKIDRLIENNAGATTGNSSEAETVATNRDAEQDMAADDAAGMDVLDRIRKLEERTKK